MEISQSVFDFVQNHLLDDTNTLRLKYSGKSVHENGFPIDFALLQIEARRKARKKLPGFLDHVDFVFPTLLAAEQASNEAVARFHASLIPAGNTLLDLTAGLGIDDMSFAMTGIDVTACELDAIKCEALSHNAVVMGVNDRINVVCGDSTAFIHHCNSTFDVVFADPARRDSKGSRTHALSDCQPDILGCLSDIMSIAPRLLVKCSPLLDLTLIRNTVNNLFHIHVVCFRGECKEVLIDIRKDSCYSGISVLDIDREHIISRFDIDNSPISSTDVIRYADRKGPADYKYLYEPNAGVMKTGEWCVLSSRYADLRKVDPNTHLFVSDTYFKDFPGRILQIESEPDKKALKALKGNRYNVVARNYPISAPQVAAKFSLLPGSDYYIYAFRYSGSPAIVKARIMQDQE